MDVCQSLEALSALLETVVVKQTRARILGGITHSPSKIVSLFEPHTEERPLVSCQRPEREAAGKMDCPKGVLAKPGLGKSLWDFHSPTTILTGSLRSSAKSVPYLLSRNSR